MAVSLPIICHPGRAGDYNQALMDLGSATICTPRAPACADLPAGKSLCEANRQLGVAGSNVPIKHPRPAVPHYTGYSGRDPTEWPEF
jgi:adenine-specific DNA glycosylase